LDLRCERICSHGPSIYLCIAAGWPEDTRDHTQDGSLSGAIRSQDAGDLAVTRNEGNTTDRRVRAEVFLQISNLNHPVTTPLFW
jgi:hypothetical protein